MGHGTGGFLQNEVLVCGSTVANEGYRNICWILGQNKNITMEHGREGGPSSIIFNDKVSILIPDFTYVIC